MAKGFTREGAEPALCTRTRSPKRWRARPSAIWLRAELATQRKRIDSVFTASLSVRRSLGASLGVCLGGARWVDVAVSRCSGAGRSGRRALQPRRWPSGGGLRGGRRALGRREPAARAVGEADEGEHHGHLDEDADDGGEGGARGEAEEADGDGDGELEEVARADHGGGGGDGVGELQHAREAVGEREDAVAL